MESNVYPEDKTRSTSKRTVFIVIILILFATNVLLIWQYFDKKQHLAEVSKSLETTLMDKDQLTAELQKVKQEYEKISEQNAGLQGQLSLKDEEIKTKIAQIQKLISSGDAESLKKAKLEIEQLKAMNLRYAIEMDSLKAANQNLVSANQTLNSTLTEEQSKVESLKQENAVLANKVALGSILKTRDLVASAVRSKRSGKEIVVTKASSAEQIKIAFTILENVVIDKGMQAVFIRILSPDGAVMATSMETILVNGKPSLYTLKEAVDYQNKDTDCTFYFPKNTAFAKGKYTVEIYNNNNQIGASSFTLK